ncbi:MAG: RNA polymerase sigma-70 factor (ECF subfamily), partial [Planctomycetota bacterium]
MGTNQPTTQDLLSQAARLHEIARRLVGDSHLADDLVQDAWVVALEADVSRASSWRDVEGWRAWIGGVARNLSARRAQRDARRREIEAVVAKSEATIEENHLSDRMHVQRQLAGAVLELDEPFRSALVMRYLDDLDYEQLAERQGISIANARQRVRRALAILRTRMGADDKGRFGVLGLLGLGDSFDKGARALASLTAGQLAIGGVVMGVK